jgi:TIR domain
MPTPLYDVALSFAGEQREYVRAVAVALRAEGVSYFFDEERAVDLWGRNLVDELDSTYSLKAAYVVMFISAEYATKVWPNVERQSAQSHAVTRGSPREPFILPVRFDDTPLPGLPASVSYQDARKTSPEDLAKLIAAKVSQTRTSDSEEDREDGWEYLLLAEELVSGIEGFDDRRRDFELGYVRPRGRRIALADIPANIEDRVAAALHISSNVHRILNPTTVTAAIGAPGEAGDPTMIRHLASRLVDVYASMLDWAADCRGSLVPDEAKRAYQALSEMMTEPLQQIRDFVAELDMTLRPLVEAIRSGNAPTEPTTIALTLTLSIPDERADHVNDELNAIRQRLN